MKIAVIGYGYVGKQVVELFKKEDLVIYDPFVQEYQTTTKEMVNEAELAIICVPTNENKDGSCDLSIVEDSVSWLETPLILIKSTILPGETDYLKDKYKKRIVFSPEYVGESKYNHSYWSTMAEAPFNIFGGDDADIDPILALYMKHCGPEKRYVKCKAKEAELTKYFENIFFATKVTVVQQFYDICEHLKIDWDTVRELWLLDPRINRMHTAVFKNNRGFGGKCYPKDLAALLAHCKETGFTPDLFDTVQKLNKKYANRNNGHSV